MSSTNGTTAKTSRVKQVVEDDGMEPVVIMPIEKRILEIPIVGISPLMICNFSEKTRNQMEETQTKGKGAVKAKKEAKNIEECFNLARYIAHPDGWDGCNAVSFRAAMISACRLVDGLSMTNAKQLIFIEPDGYEHPSMIPLVRIYGEPVRHQGTVRVGQAKTADLRYRPLYWPWKAVLRVSFNPKWISEGSLANLVAIAGDACGVGEWRPTAPKSFTGTYGRWKIDL